MEPRPQPDTPAAPARWLGSKQAWRMIYAANGGPTWQTFLIWGKPDRGQAPPGFPRPFRVPGRGGHTWDRDEIASWIDRSGATAARAARDA